MSLKSADPRIVLTETTNNSNCIFDYAAGGVLEISVDDNDVDSSSKFQVRIDGATAGMTLDSTGLGIGTTGPATKLDLRDTSTTAYPFTSADSGTYSYTPYAHEINIRNNAYGSSTSALWSGIHFHSGEQVNTAGDGSLGRQGTARISAVFQGQYKADLVFGTRNTSFAERMRLTADGKLGLATATPSSPLHAKGVDIAIGIHDYPQLTLETASTDGAVNKGSGIMFLNHDGNQGKFGGNIRVLNENGTSGDHASYMAFATRPAGGSVSEYLRINSDTTFGVNYAGKPSDFADGTDYLVKYAAKGDEPNVVGSYQLFGGTQRAANGYNKLMGYTHGYWGGSRVVASMGVLTNTTSGGAGHGFGGWVFHTGESGNGDGGAITGESLRINFRKDITTSATNDFARANVGFTARHGDSFAICRDGGTPVEINRKTNDGGLIGFFQDCTEEGNIAVSGGTVSLNGGHLSRWSQFKGLSTTDESERPTIYKGTVLSNLDDLCVWSHAETPAVLYTQDDEDNNEIPSGKNVGDVKTAAKPAWTESNPQLNMTKISDAAGDKNVAGVFWEWDDDGDDYGDYVNDFYVAMTGDMVIRVAASTTVARGDLLESAGDGTAKPQADDIVRSKTIAKITSTTAAATYADGSKAYPCVLMAC